MTSKLVCTLGCYIGWELENIMTRLMPQPCVPKLTSRLMFNLIRLSHASSWHVQLHTKIIFTPIAIYRSECLWGFADTLRISISRSIAQSFVKHLLYLRYSGRELRRDTCTEITEWFEETGTVNSDLLQTAPELVFSSCTFEWVAVRNINFSQIAFIRRSFRPKRFITIPRAQNLVSSFIRHRGRVWGRRHSASPPPPKKKKSQRN